MSDDPHIAAKAEEVVGDADTVLETLILLVEYVSGETTYYNFEVPRYPNATLSEETGDCDDQSILLISMLRSLGVPAYLQVGIYVHPSISDSQTSWEGHLINTRSGVGWHGWAMVYVPPWGWVPVDLTLTSEKDGLELLRKAPEYNGNVVSALNVSRQPYIGETLATRARILGSGLYVTVIDEAEEINGGGLGSEVYLVAGLGLAVMAAIVLMFVSSRKGSD
jgi:transglutaminase-like putative cysteine protease